MIAVVAAGIATYALRALVIVLPRRQRPESNPGSRSAFGPITLAALAGGQLAGHGGAGALPVRLLAVAIAVVVARRSGTIGVALLAAVATAALADLVW